MNNEKGMGLLMTSVIILGLIVTFLVLATFASENMFAQLGRAKRQLAGYVAMQDFALLAQKAYQNFHFNNGVCPADTTRIPSTKPFCWPNNTVSQPNANCISHPLGAPGSNRLICLNSTNIETMEVIAKNESLPWWKYFFSGMDSTAHAQSTDLHLPALTGAPIIDFSSAPTCDANFDPTFCKMCQTVGADTQNLDCIYLRICLQNATCNTSKPEHWTIQRIGVQRIFN